MTCWYEWGVASQPINRVAVVGTGVIGSSWAACFLARGLDVIASDPAPGAEERLHAALALRWPALERIGLAAGASMERLAFAASPEDAVAAADFVQESGPERADTKQQLFAQLDSAAPPSTLLASSSSGVAPTAIQARCTHPERVLVGHPFNPPHLVPLVEVVGGERTDPVAIDRAMAFYSALGKHPIRLKREIPGHVANRLQAALWREAFHLLERGVASVAASTRPSPTGRDCVGGCSVRSSICTYPAAMAACIMSWSTSGHRSSGGGTTSAIRA
jgi:3-hydroxyacyl-CoA dehydrogenase